MPHLRNGFEIAVLRGTRKLSPSLADAQEVRHLFIGQLHLVFHQYQLSVRRIQLPENALDQVFCSRLSRVSSGCPLSEAA